MKKNNTIWLYENVWIVPILCSIIESFVSCYLKDHLSSLLINKPKPEARPHFMFETSLFNMQPHQRMLRTQLFDFGDLGYVIQVF